MSLEKTLNKLKSGEELIISALGDSLTQGWMVSKGYVDYIYEMLSEKYSESKIKIINRGIPGDTSSNGLFRVQRDVLIHEPDLVIVQFALNDAFMGMSSGSFKKTISQIIERIQLDTTSEILLITSVPILFNKNEDKMAEDFYHVLAEISKEKKVEFVQVHKYWKNKVKEGLDSRLLYQADGVHPTVQGYKIMAEAIMEAF